MEAVINKLKIFLYYSKYMGTGEKVSILCPKKA